MTDLEDKFLKKNVPGRCSQWDEYNDSTTEQEDEVNDECNSILESSGKARPQKFPNRRNNTGAKGVLQDYRDAKQMNAMQQAVKEEEKQETIRRQTRGEVLACGEISLSLASIENRKRQETVERLEYVESSDSEESDIEDDDFLRTYRQNRMKQMQQCVSWPVYGTVENIGIDQFSSVIDKNDHRAFCIFHLYEDGIAPCALLDQHLIVLAEAMNYCNFFRMKISDIKPNFDAIGFPCVLMYRSGKEVANLTPITEHIPTLGSDRRFTIEDIKKVLELHGAINPYSR